MEREERKNEILDYFSSKEDLLDCLALAITSRILTQAKEHGSGVPQGLHKGTGG